MKAQGIDFGGYTEWKRNAIKPGKQVDFVICGIGWGSFTSKTWIHNKPEIMKEDRRLLYHFYNHTPPWEEQADLALKEYESVNAHAMFIDWERSTWGVRMDKDMPRQSHDLYRIMTKIQNNVGGRVGMYSNGYDYYLAQQYFDFSKFPWWAADPDEWKEDHPISDTWWRRSEREKYDYHFDQWSWKGYAPDYGAVNNKKSMDLTQFKWDLPTLDAWLGIGEAPEPPTVEGYADGWDDALERVKQEINSIKR